MPRFEGQVVSCPDDATTQSFCCNGQLCWNQRQNQPTVSSWFPEKCLQASTRFLRCFRCLRCSKTRTRKKMSYLFRPLYFIWNFFLKSHFSSNSNVAISWFFFFEFWDISFQHHSRALLCLLFSWRCLYTCVWFLVYINLFISSSADSMQAFDSLSLLFRNLHKSSIWFEGGKMSRLLMQIDHTMLGKLFHHGTQSEENLVDAVVFLCLYTDNRKLRS